MIDREEIVELKDQKPNEGMGSKKQHPLRQKAKYLFLFVFTTVGFPILGLFVLSAIMLLLMFAGGAGEWFEKWLVSTFR
ncbi:MAG TPA: hypothetical protein VL625_09170 [Patescibacteria group bacterium]|jgi:hypothetical protein|nr:hypothetical protein [Patescibacteria group bacterium]